MRIPQLRLAEPEGPHTGTVWIDMVSDELSGPNGLCFSPDYRKLWGVPDDQAWERALDHYLTHHVDFSDIQDQRPLPLHELELTADRR